MLYVLYLFVKRTMVSAVSYKTGFILGIAGALLSILQFLFMGRFLSDGNSFPALQQYGGNLLAYLIIGTAFTGFVGVALNSFQSTVRSEQQMGTLEFFLMSSVPVEVLLVVSGLVSFARALVNVAVLLYVVSSVFAVPLGVNVFGAFISVVLTVAALSGIGLMSAGVVIVTKAGDPIAWVFTALTGLLSGVLFPVEYLPAYLQAVSNILPTTHALHALRVTLVNGMGVEAIVNEVKLLVIMACVTIPLGLLAVKWGFYRARKVGSLSQY